MKHIYIPNSLHFSAIPTGTDKFMSIFNITTKTHSVINEGDPRVTKANKYLKRSYRRLVKLAINKHPLRFTKVAKTLITKSFAFRLAAINFKWPKWFYTGTGTDAKDIFRTVLKLSSSLSAAIEYSRHWIPKGDKPWMRPIGNPTVPWRIQLWEWYFITDIWTAYNGGRAPWQHGGFSKKGPNTFFEQLISEGRYKKPWIFEFDLKGYFNNVTHEAIMNALKSVKTPKFILDHMAAALIAKPNKYYLPPLTEDEAVRIQEEYILAKEEIINDLVGIFTPDPGEDDPAEILFALVQKEGDSPEMVLTNLAEELNSFIEAEVPLSKIYESHMKGNKLSLIDYLDLESFHDKDREKGRDLWANLGLPGRGTPQGVSYSPLLTSILSSVSAGIENVNLMMYMDDGIITADTKQELDRAIESFKKAADSMGVELAPSKSGMIKEDGVWLKELKIIGFRIDPWMEWVFSKTRSGTEVPMPQPDYKALKEYYAGKEDQLRKEITTFSEGVNSKKIELSTTKRGDYMKSFNDWILKEIDSKGLNEFIDSGLKELNKYPLTSHEAMVKEGKSGQALAEIWNPDKGDVRNQISEGLLKTVEKIKSNKRSWLANHIGDYQLETLGTGGYIQESISSLSTEMSRSALEWDSRIKQKKVQSKGAKKSSPMRRPTAIYSYAIGPAGKPPTPHILDKNWRQYLKLYNRWCFNKWYGKPNR